MFHRLQKNYGALETYFLKMHNQIEFRTIFIIVPKYFSLGIKFVLGE